MIESKKVSSQISDYILDLLSPVERKRVEEDAAKSTAYQTKLQQEREIEQLIRATLQQTPMPDRARLQQLMPPIPQQKRPFPFFHNRWQKQLLAVAVLAIFFIGSFSLYQSQQNPIYNSSPTLTAATATFTNEPTVTVAQTDTKTATSTAVASQPKIESNPTPATIATPIAALPTMN